jgi:sodium/potassium-transporting ATPase subunit alpha
MGDTVASEPASVQVSISKSTPSREYDVREHFPPLSELPALFPASGINTADPSASRGLSSADAAAELAENGPNCLTPPPGTPEWLKFLRGFLDPFMVVLAAAGALCFLAYGLGDTNSAVKTNAILGSVLLAVVFLTVLATYIQGRSTGSVMASFKQMMSSETTVIRDGHEMKVPTENLVVGDVVHILYGSRIPADLRVLSHKDMKVDLSSLTGEPDAVACTVEHAHDLPAEARNLVFNSSLVLNGDGYGVVIRTGDKTFIGSIAGLASATTGARSNMENEVLHFVHNVTKIALVTSILFFVIGVARVPTKAGAINAFINGFILVMVAYVPEGLPATVATCLQIASKRMGERHVFVKKPDIIEALGAATVICSDKTGTLTQNRMTVENLFVNTSMQNARTKGADNLSVSVLAAFRNLDGHDAEGRAQMTVRSRNGASLGAGCAPTFRPSILDVAKDSGGGKLPQSPRYNSFSKFATLSSMGKFSHASWSRSSEFMKLVTAAGICNRARFLFEEDDAASDPATKKAAKIEGDASDTALLRFVEENVSSVELRLSFRTIFEIPFNSVNKWSLAVIRDPEPKSAPSMREIMTHVALLKGAPEVILQRCTSYAKNGVVRKIDEDFLTDYRAAYERFAFLGERVLGFAYKEFNGPIDDSRFERDEALGTLLAPRDDLVFLGLISLVDPPREGVAEAVGKCRTASIKVTMVTGDHPLTAEAIARKVGIITLPTARMIALQDECDEHEVSLSDERVRAVVLAGPELRNLTEEQWDVILSKEECVFARTTPQQKLQIVEHYQRRGEVVAVTGDGVNDSPALKKANIGVAMGNAGASDVAREAADIILMDDNFASIVGAIEEGRTLFDNLKKSIAYTIAHTIPELVPTLLNLWFSMPLGMPGLVLLTIDLLSEQGPSVSFAYERAEDSIMLRPPRKMGVDRLVSYQIIFYSYVVAGLGSSLVCLFSFLMVYVRAGVPLSSVWMANMNGAFTNDDSAASFTAGGKTFDVAAQNAIYFESVAAWYCTIIANQFWHLWVCKTRSVSIFVHGFLSNPVCIGGAIASLATAVVFTYIPQVQVYFFTAALAGPIWACSLSFGGFIFSYTELVKLASRKNPKGWIARNLSW